MAGNDATQQDINLQKAYLQSWIENISPVRDYRYETGFRFKKVMYGHRYYNPSKQNIIETTFGIYDFNCPNRTAFDAIPHSNYCKVCPVIIPNLTLNKSRVQEINKYCKQNNIWGSFLYTYQMKPLGNVFGGNLNWLTVNNYEQPNVHHGALSAVYPYYHFEIRAYKPYLEFNHLNMNFDTSYRQCRFTLNERIKGVEEYNTADALNRIRIYCTDLFQNPNNANKRFVAFYVDQNTTLAVRFENNKYDHQWNGWRGFHNKDVCHHERVLVQHHGFVGLQNYDLTFKFSAKENHLPYTFQQLAQLLNPNKIYQHPLIAVRRVTDGQQPHFAGYNLEIQNLVDYKACLIFPSDYKFTVHELMPGVDQAGKMLESEGLKYMTAQWLGEEFTDLTGPFRLVTDGRTQQAFPNSFY